MFKTGISRLVLHFYFVIGAPYTRFTMRIFTSSSPCESSSVYTPYGRSFKPLQVTVFSPDGMGGFEAAAFATLVITKNGFEAGTEWCY
jgi:hypothetical protein